MAISNVIGRGKGRWFKVICKYLIILQQVKMQKKQFCERKKQEQRFSVYRI